MSGSSNSGLYLTSLCVERPDGQVLLHDASLSLREGETILLMGPAGSGKSTVLQILAGLISNGRSGWKISGKLGVSGREFDLATGPYVAGTMVFQDLALFDDLTVRDNLAVAASHAGSRSVTIDALARLLTAGLDPDVSVNTCSGGQRQMVATARTLLANPNVLLFDEPNSGLDVGSTARLVEAIKIIRSQSSCPMLITAHHAAQLLPIATRVVLLDPRAKRFVPVDNNSDSIDFKLLEFANGRNITRRFSDRAGAAPEIATAPVVARASRLFWAGQYFRRYLWQLCLAPEALIYVGLGALLIGFVSTWFTFRSFPMSSYTSPLFHGELLAGIGFAQFRILIPLFAGMLLASRTGAIIAADLGHRSYSRQIDAMRNLGIPQGWYLSANIMFATIVTSIFFAAFMFTVAAWVSFETWTILFPGESRHLWQENFFALIWHAESSRPIGTNWVLVKTMLGAIGVGLVGTFLGRTKKESLIDLNRGIALAIVSALAVVLLVHTVAAILEF